jgi:hypothetical protein
VITRLSFVYDADGTFAGELKYYFGSLIGRAHCALCDITHTKVGKRKAFGECADALALPIDYFHRNDVPAEVVSAAGGRWPAVVGHSDDGAVLLLGPEALEACGGDVTDFERRLTDSLQQT